MSFVRPGQPIRADDLNSLWEASRASVQFGNGRGLRYHRGVWEWAVNRGDDDIMAGNGCYLSDQTMDASMNPAGREDTLFITGVSTNGVLGIALEPLLAHGGGGRVLVLGTVWANVTGSGGKASLATATGPLALGSSGSVPVIATVDTQARVLLSGNLILGDSNWLATDV